jgi:uncharacterized protein YyaL (SSP411 family)
MNNKQPNRLIFEKSPYLLQHAYNPVNWYAWNDESLEEAQKKNRPIFLSVGYSSCYWCHVMERECFENEEIAKLLNEHFICIKVDREERTDIDRIYMTALQSMTGSGGWPMSLFLTPDLKPFYAATYIPPKAKYGRAGFEDVIYTINNLWRNKKNEIVESSNKIAEILNSRLSEFVKLRNIDESVLQKCFEQCEEYFDYENGGFGNGNKFPRTVIFDFLLSYYYSQKKLQALDIVTFSFKKMCKGGIFDHIGGGFHRYSVDRYWRVPHFEKMLYDQAQNSDILLDLYKITNDNFYLEFAKHTLNYVSDNLTDNNGGFYSAEDAESAVNSNYPEEKEEGFYYLWTLEEINKILKKKDADIFCYYFGIRFEGNTINDPHNVFKNKNVLYLANDIFDTSKHFGMSGGEVEISLTNSLNILNDVRNRRPKPFKDDKILTNWNSLMISAFCKAYQVTGNKKYLEKATNAAEFILNNLFKDNDNNLFHRFRDNEAKMDGTLEDYSFLIKSLIDLYESDFILKYLEKAIGLIKKAVDNFYDNENGGFYDNDINAKDLFITTKDSYDGAEPSGNSIMIQNLYRLGNILNDNNLIEKANKSLEYFYEQIYKSPFQSPRFVYDINYYLNPSMEILVTGDNNEQFTNNLVSQIHRKYLPFKTLIYANKDSEKIIGYLKNIVKDFDNTNVYICENFKCHLPVNNIEDLNKLLLK